ncbi:hypothetical protein TNCV_3885251 [Trichonephila clavipes]|nr:hypothetical protein TNCV_3885251 [Trichonephila clavipes]
MLGGGLRLNSEKRFLLAAVVASSTRLKTNQKPSDPNDTKIKPSDRLAATIMPLDTRNATTHTLTITTSSFVRLSNDSLSEARRNEETSLSNYSDWNNPYHTKESSGRIVFRFLGSHKHSPECPIDQKVRLKAENRNKKSFSNPDVHPVIGS